ncbi:hypothetical protein [Brevibacterium linens]|uniref:hypothetical protein n=2 Tax=Actinomycetes TaxID=1760 RepID=UPI003F8A5E39
MVDINKMQSRGKRTESQVEIHPSTRPPEKKNKNVIVRITEDEHARLREKTFREHTSIQSVVSDFIRTYIDSTNQDSMITRNH